MSNVTSLDRYKRAKELKALITDLRANTAEGIGILREMLSNLPVLTGSGVHIEVLEKFFKELPDDYITSFEIITVVDLESDGEEIVRHDWKMKCGGYSDISTRKEINPRFMSIGTIPHHIGVSIIPPKMDADWLPSVYHYLSHEPSLPRSHPALAVCASMIGTLMNLELTPTYFKATPSGEFVFHLIDSRNNCGIIFTLDLFVIPGYY